MSSSRIAQKTSPSRKCRRSILFSRPLQPPDSLPGALRALSLLCRADNLWRARQSSARLVPSLVEHGGPATSRQILLIPLAWRSTLRTPSASLGSRPEERPNGYNCLERPPHLWLDLHSHSLVSSGSRRTHQF